MSEDEKGKGTTLFGRVIHSAEEWRAIEEDSTKAKSLLAARTRELTELAQKHDAALQRLEQVHQALAIEQARCSDLDAQRKELAKVAALARQRDARKTQVAVDGETKRAEAAEARARALEAKLREAEKRGAELEELAKEHEAKRASLEKAYAAKLDSVEKGHAAKLASVERAYAAKLDALSKENAAKLDALSKDNAERRTELAKEHAARYEKTAKESAARLVELSKENAANMKALAAKSAALEEALRERDRLRKKVEEGKVQPSSADAVERLEKAHDALRARGAQLEQRLAEEVARAETERASVATRAALTSRLVAGIAGLIALVFGAGARMAWRFGTGARGAALRASDLPLVLESLGLASEVALELEEGGAGVLQYRASTGDEPPTWALEITEAILFHEAGRSYARSVSRSDDGKITVRFAPVDA